MKDHDLTLNCPVLENGESIQVEHTCDGDNVPPPLEWNNVPEGARSMALVMDDPDAPGGTFTHWLLWNLAPDQALGTAVDLSTAGVPGTNDFDRIGYGGPCPPRGHGAHRYRFKLYALDVPSLGLPKGASRGQLEAAMKGHVLDRTELVGRYARGGQS